MLLRSGQRLGLFAPLIVPLAPTQPPLSIDYVPMYPPPTVATQVSSGMQPMGSGASAASAGGAFHGSPPASTSGPMFTPGPTTVDYAPATVPAVVAPTAPNVTIDPAQLAPPGLVHLLNPFDPQRSVPLIAGVAGAGVLGLVLFLRR